MEVFLEIYIISQLKLEKNIVSAQIGPKLNNNHIMLKYAFGPLSLHKVMFWSLNFEKCVFGPLILEKVCFWSLSFEKCVFCPLTLDKVMFLVLWKKDKNVFSPFLFKIKGLKHDFLQTQGTENILKPNLKGLKTYFSKLKD